MKFQIYFLSSMRFEEMAQEERDERLDIRS